MSVHEIYRKIKKVIDEKENKTFIDNNNTDEILEKSKNFWKEEMWNKIKEEKRKKIIQDDIQKQKEGFLQNLKKKQKKPPILEGNWSFQVINYYSNIRIDFSILTDKFIEVQINKKPTDKENEIIQIPSKHLNGNIDSIRVYMEVSQNQNTFLLTNNLKTQKMLFSIKNLIETYVLFINKIFYKENFLKSLQKIVRIYNEKYLNYINIYEDYFYQIKEANSYIMGLETGRESVMGMIDYLKEEEQHEITKKEDNFNKLIEEEIFDFHNIGFIKNKNISILYMQDKILLEFLKIINQKIKT